MVGVSKFWVMEVLNEVLMVILGSKFGTFSEENLDWRFWTLGDGDRRRGVHLFGLLRSSLKLLRL